ncbi:MAG TPA: rhomboid family intramembrane serine protease [Desulfohalobiaceae bacterium]|nr:rhomboid family intramembrane serine protease [Desulfohalobiaceae bacterium]
MWLDISESIKRLLDLETFSKKEVWEWSLVLSSKSIPHELSFKDSEWQIWVPLSLMGKALYEIEIYTQENQERITADKEPSFYGRFEPTFWIFLFLILFYKLSHSDLIRLKDKPLAWNQIGCVDVWEVCQGQWWRLVTGLTLHGSITHLLSNVVVGSVFVIMVCRNFGSGFGWFCVLLAGIIGNGLNCLVQPYEHSSIGSSTSIFGAVGLMAGARIFRESDQGLFKQVLPFMAGLGLLALLGTGGKNTDLGAHIFGFLSGLVVGFLVRGFPITFSEQWLYLNRIFGLLALGIILFSWSVAIF